MARRLNVHFLPQEVREPDLAESAAIVIDLLRASTTICQALDSGASEVVPFLEIEDVLEAVSTAPGRSNIVLGGERSGGIIPGFDLGNSPSEYTPEAVAGKRVFITTTNGTRALHHARLARRIVVGAAVNISAVTASLLHESRIDIVCAGTGLERTREDILAAGAFADKFMQSVAMELNEQARTAHKEWLNVLGGAAEANRSVIEQFAIELRNTQGGRNLSGIGLDEDLIDCAQVDRLKVVPELDVSKWRINA